ncbi:ABC transporter substrate-binding protein [Microlunatus speluncae]|uniref:ABC transporter substrate-binding protein n=1 Tax=Microlunatus speluncae TaxID=2594267 RepID=UPI0012664FB6|nr:ABC transporter substrate-binding protein [Microlunatus speluncae]
MIMVSSRPTRRAVLGGLAGLAGATALTACQASQPEAPPPSAPATQTQRVVALDPFSTHNLLDFGLPPVGAQAGLDRGVFPEHRELYAALPKVGEYFEPDFEAIAALAPELILASTGQREFAAKLEAIAPTTLITAESSATWPQAAREIAAATDRMAEHDRLRDAYLARCADIRSRRAAVLGRDSWSVVWLATADGFSVRPADSNGAQVLALSGVRFDAVTAANPTGKDVKLSWEEADRIADAGVICLPGRTDGGTDPATELALAQPSFRALPAVRDGRIAIFKHITPGSYRNATALADELDAFLGAS